MGPSKTEEVAQCSSSCGLAASWTSRKWAGMKEKKVPYVILFNGRVLLSLNICIKFR